MVLDRGALASSTLAVALVLALLPAACARPAPSPPPPSPPSPAAAAPVAVASDEGPAFAVVALEAVRVETSADGARTEAQARASGRELRVSFATPRRGWRVSAGSEPGVLVTAGGPPGGPSGFSVTVVERRGDARALLEAFAQRRGEGPGREPFERGALEPVTVASRAHDAIAFAVGRSMARARHCAYLVDAGGLTLVVQALVGGVAAPRCADVLAEPTVRELSESLAVGAEPPR